MSGERYNPVSHHDEELKQQDFVGERALYRSRNLVIRDSVFRDGESPLKECGDIEVVDCEFQWKYPLWYCENVRVKDSVWQEMARSGVWYTNNISVEDSLISAPKNFRRCRGVEIRNVCMPKAEETLWSCQDVRLEKIDAQGDYFGMNSSDVEVDGLKLYGNYAFDGGRNITVRNSKLLSKDCFWNCENGIHIVMHGCPCLRFGLRERQNEIRFVNMSPIIHQILGARSEMDVGQSHRAGSSKTGPIKKRSTF